MEYVNVLLWGARNKSQAEKENLVLSVAFSRSMSFQKYEEHFGIIDSFPNDPIEVTKQAFANRLETMLNLLNSSRN